MGASASKPYCQALKSVTLTCGSWGLRAAEVAAAAALAAELAVGETAREVRLGRIWCPASIPSALTCCGICDWIAEATAVGVFSTPVTAKEVKVGRI